MPSVEKYPGLTIRIRPCGPGSPGASVCPSISNDADESPPVNGIGAPAAAEATPGIDCRRATRAW